MSSRDIQTALDTGVVIHQIGAALTTLKDAERNAAAKMHAIEKALRKLDPGVEVWAGPIVEDVVTASAPEPGAPALEATRQVWIGFARADLLPGFGGWFERRGPWNRLAKVWGLAIREEVRAKSEERPLIRQDVSLLRRAPRESCILAAPHLDQLLRAIHDEVKARVDRLPDALKQPVSERKEAPASKQQNDQAAGEVGAVPVPA